MKTIMLPECLCPLYDLSEKKPELEGILTVGYTETTIKRYMSDYYASEAGVSTQMYDLVVMYKQVFMSALSQLRPHITVNALELGCGYGSSTYAMSEIFSDMRIIATELSLPMLIRHKCEGKHFSGVEKNIIRLQLNADDTIFKDNSFDMVFGTAILHHTIDPLKIIENTAKILKPNGIAIFCEPFEPGYGFLKIAYKFLLLLDKKRVIRLDKKQRAYLVNTIAYWDSMCFLTRTDSFFTNIDDKWLFSYSFFDDTAQKAGFDIILKQPISPTQRGNYIKWLFNSHTSGNGIVLPNEADEVIELIDSIFTTEQLQTMPGDGVLILQKSLS